MILWTILLAGMGSNAFAERRTATIAVSATVLASCRIDVASHVASPAAAPIHRGQCSGSTRPATRAVLETAGPSLAKAAVQTGSETFTVASADGAHAASWIRLDVEY